MSRRGRCGWAVPLTSPPPFSCPPAQLCPPALHHAPPTAEPPCQGPAAAVMQALGAFRGPLGAATAPGALVTKRQASLQQVLRQAQQRGVPPRRHGRLESRMCWQCGLRSQPGMPGQGAWRGWRRARWRQRRKMARAVRRLSFFVDRHSQLAEIFTRAGTDCQTKMATNTSATTSQE